MSPVPNIISIRNVTKRFPGVVALSDVTLDIRQGEFLSIGENFNAEVGFAPRVDMRQHILRAGFGPRPKALGLRQLEMYAGGEIHLSV